MLKISNKSVISDRDWSEFVSNVYGRRYKFQQQDGCQSRGKISLTVPSNTSDFPRDKVPEEINGSIMGVSFAAWLERDPEVWNGKPDPGYYLDLFWHRNFYPKLQIVANDLYERGLLPGGKYKINIDW